jgi:hypothetical protein
VYKSLGSLIKLNDRILAVDEALKAIIERLESGVHQFFPIEIMMPSDKAPSVRYYVLVIGNYCDSFIPKAVRKDLGRLTAQITIFLQRIGTEWPGLLFRGLFSMAPICGASVVCRRR